MTKHRPFHLAFSVKDIQSTREFYTKIMGCTEGRSSDHSIVYNFFGNQLVAHVVGEKKKVSSASEVDHKNVPVPHFGAVLEVAQFHKLSKTFEEKGVTFIFKPHKRFKGKQKAEQWTMFVKDFSGNALEFKAFEEDEGVFDKASH